MQRGLGGRGRLVVPEQHRGAGLLGLHHGLPAGVDLAAGLLQGQAERFGLVVGVVGGRITAIGEGLVEVCLGATYRSILLLLVQGSGTGARS